MHVALVRHLVANRPRRRNAAFPLALAAACATLALSVLAAPSLARPDAWVPVDRNSSVEQGPIAVSVTVGGWTTPLYQRADRTDRWYLEAREGANYQVKVRNLTGQRVAFVISVDGLNAINGLRSHLGSDEPMYVLDPYQVTTVKGWRKSLSDVSKFVFVDEERSYAARTDQANGDLGWIRVVAFEERRPQVWRDFLGYRGAAPGAPAPAAPNTWGSTKSQLRDQSNAPNSLDKGEAARDMAPLADGRAQESNPGTGWGGNQRDHVRETDFDPQPYAAAHVILRYEYRDALERLGVLPWQDRGRDRLREREDGELGFAQPPRW